jgi:HAD superfamily hydrolase (TIGR01458 family)
MIQGVVLDLSGVLYVGETAVPGAIEAIECLQNSSVPHCFITNTSRRTLAMIEQSLQRLGFSIAADDIFTAASAALDYLRGHDLTAHALVHANLRDDFAPLQKSKPNAVVLGDAAEGFTYDNLNRAFRVLMQDADTPLISMGYNRYFMESDGLSLDLGAFTAALEFASGKQAIIMGKPSKDFFLLAVHRLGCEPQQVLMIGDDVESDVNGALHAGLQACLVKTGKYRNGDEGRIDASDFLLAADIAEVIDRVLDQGRH